MKKNLTQLEKKIGYAFTNKNILIQALTHRSSSNINNERLEFLGDALLETIISVYLFNQYPKTAEGDLTKLRASLVNQNSLAQIARNLDLGNYLYLGAGELKTGGYRRDSILSDALESLLAAIYLDSNFSTCEQVTLQLFTDSFANLPEKIDYLKDYKSKLQEYLQGRNLPLPIYQLIKETGEDHCKQFELICTSQNHRTYAIDYNKKKAEQQAAKKMLEIYQNNQATKKASKNKQ